MVSNLATGNEGYAWAMIVLTVFAVIGLGAALLLPKKLPSIAPETNLAAVYGIDPD